MQARSTRLAGITNLPLPVTSFIARDEVAAVRQAIASRRLITLVGAGGCGKTRLALEAAAERIGEHEHGVFMVELGLVREESMVDQAVASAIGVREEPATPIETTLVDFLASRRLLLVLDNCEHVLASCARLVSETLRRAADVVILATSREPLGVSGEALVRVPPMRTPAGDVDARALAGVESARLFVERAGLVSPGFALTDENAGSVAEICRRLDGIPLAIELAASRTASLTPRQIAERLHDRFGLLASRTTTAVPRQRTLAGLLDWSYELLPAGDQRAFRRLGIMAGFTLDAGERVAGLADRALDAVTSLVDRSLVTRDDHEDEPRYRMLETIREYALTKLAESGDEPAARAAQLAWMDELSARAEEDLEGPRQAAALEQLDAELDNIRGTLEWSLRAGSHEPGLLIAGRLMRFWEARGYFRQGQALLEQLLDIQGGVDTPGRVKALGTAGILAIHQGDLDGARRHLEESAELARRRGDDPGFGGTLGMLGVVAHQLGEYERARDLYEQSVQLARSVGDKRAVLVACGNLARLMVDAEELEPAERLFGESLALAVELGSDFAVALVEGNIARVKLQRGELEESEALNRRSLDVRRRIGDRRGIANCLFGLGEVALARRDPAAAVAWHTEALAIRHDLGERVSVAESLEAVAEANSLRGDYARGAELLGLARALRESMRSVAPPFARRRVERVRRICGEVLGEDACEAAIARGAALSLARALAEAKEPQPQTPRIAAPAGGRERELRRSGEFWSITFGDQTINVRSSKGMTYLAHLLAKPGAEAHVLEMSVQRGEAAASARGVAEEGALGTVVEEGIPLLDPQARAAYKARLDELRSELEEAREFADLERASRAQAEMDALLDALAAAVGLGGRDRTVGSAAEKARVNVTRAIRSAIERMARDHPALAHHLATTVQTGVFCSYLPAPGEQRWVIA